jgi:hypothetical protein
MAWTYLAVSADSLRHFPPGSDQLPTASVTSTAKESWPAVRWSISYPGLQFGTMCGLWTEQHSRVWTSSMADSPARTSALRATARAWRESEAAWLARYSGLSKSRGQRLSFWKTWQPLGPAAKNEWSKNWPRSGMTVAGTCYPLTTWERRTSETDGSSLLPTPSASSYGTNKGGAAGRVGKERPSLQTMAKRAGGKLDPRFVEWMMGYPKTWTVCEPWAMPSSPRKRAKRSAG